MSEIRPRRSALFMADSIGRAIGQARRCPAMALAAVRQVSAGQLEARIRAQVLAVERGRDFLTFDRGEMTTTA